MSKIYNVGLFGNNHVGKTLLAETILYKTGMIDRIGEISQGNTIFDFDAEEISRQMSLNLGFGYVKKGDAMIYILDAPGYMDFIGEQVCGIESSDIGILVVGADEGITPSTEKQWELITKKGMPAALFINRMDLPEVEFNKVWEEMESFFGKKLLLVNYPLKEGSSLKGVANLLGAKVGENPDFDPYVQASMDVIAELDDTLMEKYLEGVEISADEMAEHIKKGFKEGSIIPVLTGSVTQQVGVQELVDFILQYMPSSEEMLPFKAVNAKEEEQEFTRTPDQPLIGLVAKTIFDPFAGKISYLRVCSGRLKSNSQFLNVTKGQKERVGQLLRIQGKKQEPVDEALPGEVVGVAKLSESQALDAFCDPNASWALNLSKMPEGAVSYSIRPKIKGTEDKLGNALNRIVEEDKTINVFRDEETGETIVSGMGDTHIDIAINKFRTKFGVEVEKGIPKIAYKETIVSHSGPAEGKFKRQSGGKGQYGHCFIEIEPLERGAGFEFVDAIVGGAIPRNFIPSVEKGIKESLKKGILAGYPIVDIKVKLYDGTYHTVDSSDIAFQVAGSLALQKGFMQANPILLEPIVNVDISVSQELIGDVIGTVNSKRGKVLDMGSSGKRQVIKAQVPLAEMANYTNELRSITSGTGTYTMVFSHYEVVPAHIAQKIIDERKKEKEAKES
ncbi:elongation factor G [bacterium]|nr:elongation factor G [bacterium]